MILSSTAFQDNKPLPSRFAYHGVTGGVNASPPLRWSDPPQATASFALTVIDLHPVARQWVHWIVAHLPPDAMALEEGASLARLPKGALELMNSFGEPGYGGPMPPKGSGRHDYLFTLYALSTNQLNLSLNSSLSAFLKSIEQSILARATLTGTYER